VHPGEYSTDLVGGKALDYLTGALEEDRPFFLTVAPIASHSWISHIPRDIGKGFIKQDIPASHPRHLRHFPVEQLPRTPAFNPDKPQGVSWVKTLPKLVRTLGLVHCARLSLRCRTPPKKHTWTISSVAGCDRCRRWTRLWSRWSRSWKPRASWTTPTSFTLVSCDGTDLSSCTERQRTTAMPLAPTGASRARRWVTRRTSTFRSLCEDQVSRRDSVIRSPRTASSTCLARSWNSPERRRATRTTARESTYTKRHQHPNTSWPGTPSASIGCWASRRASGEGHFEKTTVRRWGGPAILC